MAHGWVDAADYRLSARPRQGHHGARLRVWLCAPLSMRWSALIRWRKGGDV